MKYISRIIILGLLLAGFAACKKGEEDPRFSLRTRKNRLSGDWHMVSGRASITAPGMNNAYIFDGSGMRLDVTSNKPVYYVGTYMLWLDLKKDGKFHLKENYAGAILEADGEWNFNEGVGKDEKSKQAIIFTIKDVAQGYTYGNNLFNRFSVSFIYKIKQLKNKEIVLESAGKFYSDSKGNYVTLSTEYIFQQ